MSKRGFRKQIKSLELRIEEHEDKIRMEKEKTQPDDGIIHHWRAEIETFRKNLRKAMKARKGKVQARVVGVANEFVALSMPFPAGQNRTWRTP